VATTSIWRVKDGLGGVVEYIENPEKTQSLDAVLDYAANGEKTAHRFYVAGVNCSPATARAEMLAVKKKFGKADGVAAYHGYQSFAPGEATPDTAHEIGIKLAEKLWGESYQVVVTTHLDKQNHLHNHFVVDTVSCADGRRYHRTAKDYHDMKALSDELCREYGLSVIPHPQPERAKHYGEWRAEQEGRTTWRGLVKADIDAAIAQAQTDRQFFELLRQKGYAVKMGKDISVRPPGKERFVRLCRNFGEEYTIENIRKQILAHRFQPPPNPPKKQALVVARFSLRGNLSRAKKITGYRALYFQYLYKMGILPKKKRAQRIPRAHFLFKEDLTKITQFDEETRLLWREKIDAQEQLLSFRESESISKKEAKICDRILARVPVMRGKMATVNMCEAQDENLKAEVKNRNEHIR